MPDAPLYAGECLLVLAGGVMVIVGMAALLARTSMAAAWNRAVWQIALLGLLGLVIVELTGLGSALATGVRRNWDAVRRAQPAPVVLEPSLAGHEAMSIDETPLAIESDHAVAASVAGSNRAYPFQEKTGNGVAATVDSVAVEAAMQAAPDAGWSSWAAWLLGVWGSVGAALLARCLGSHLLARRFCARCRRVDDPLLSRRVAALAARLGVRGPVVLLEYEGLAAPMAFGLWGRGIVLPAAFTVEYPPAQQDAVLAHELAHLAGHDPAWLLLAEVVCGGLWWQPLAWWARGRLHAASERAADDASVLVPGGPQLLADCLVRVGRRLARPAAPAWVSTQGRFRSGLGRRVERLLAEGPRTYPRQTARWLSCAKASIPVILVFIAVSCTAWARSQAEPSEGDDAMQVLASSWQRSLAAAVVAAFMGSSSEALADKPAEGDRPAVRSERESAQEQPRSRDAEGRRREEPRRGNPEQARPEARRDAAPPGRGEGPEALARKRQELEEEARKIQERLQNLPKDQGTLAERLEEELRAIRRKIGELARPAAARMPDREQIARHLEELKTTAERLVREGKTEEAERIKSHADQIKRQFSERLQPRRDAPPGSPRPEEGRRDVGRDGARPGPGPEDARLVHLRAAVGNLHAAGLHEQAERLSEEAERMLGDRREPRPEPDRPPRGDGPRRGPSEAAGPRDPAVSALMNEVQQLRREMNELRRELQRLRGQEPREER